MNSSWIPPPIQFASSKKPAILTGNFALKGEKIMIRNEVLFDTKGNNQ
jgi:hypothetical protein